MYRVCNYRGLPVPHYSKDVRLVTVGALASSCQGYIVHSIIDRYHMGEYVPWLSLV